MTIRIGFSAYIVLWCIVIPFSFTLAATQSPASDILLITIDTCRADHFGCYGDHLAHTGTIDRLAERSALYTDAWTDIPITLPAHTSLLSALPATIHRVTGNGLIIPESLPMIAEYLSGRGYHTAAFVSGYPLKARFGIKRGFEIYDDVCSDPVPGAPPERIAEHIVQSVIAFVEKDNSPTFLWVHFYDPHAPYLPPEPFRSLYPKDNYRGEIAYVDHYLWKLLQIWFQKNGDQNTIILLADHGEGLGDHYEQTHGVFLYQETVHIPLLIYDSCNGSGSLSCRSIPIFNVFSQIPITRLFTNNTLGTPQNILLTRYPFDRFFWAPLSAFRSDRFKYIRAPVPELYDLSSDPGETINLIDQYPHEVSVFSEKLDKGTKNIFRISMDETIDRETERQLASLGYIVPVETFNNSSYRPADPKTRAFLLPPLEKALEALHNSRQNVSNRIFETLWAYDPWNPVINNNLGLSALQDNQLNTALGFFTMSLRFQPDNAEILNNLGVVYRRMKRLKRAEEVFRKAVSHRENFGAAHFNLALTLFESGRFAEAKVEIGKAVRYDPDLVYSMSYRDLLDMLEREHHEK